MMIGKQDNIIGNINHFMKRQHLILCIILKKNPLGNITTQDLIKFNIKRLGDMLQIGKW